MEVEVEVEVGGREEGGGGAYRRTLTYGCCQWLGMVVELVGGT
jgi:hypothetical protein